MPHLVCERSAGQWRNPRLAGRIAELDGVRGLAILLVLSLHYVREISCTSWPSVFRLGWSGVDLFFVLSGFLIGGILLDARDSENYFRTFYLRRLFRIVPAYFLWMGAFGIGLCVVRPHAPEALAKIFRGDVPLWSYPLFVQNIEMGLRQSYGPVWMAATWSLAVEEQFYLLLPLLIRKLPRRTMLAVTIGMIVAAPVLRTALLLSTTNRLASYMLLPCRADAFGFGILAALACRDRGAWRWLCAHRRRMVAAFVTLGAGVAAWAAHDFAAAKWIGGSWIAAFYGCLVLLAVVKPGPVAEGLLRNRALAGLGTIAYGVYLAHCGILHLCHYLVFGVAPMIHDLPSLGVTVLAMAILVVGCLASWRFVEKPLLQFARQRYGYTRESGTPTESRPQAEAWLQPLPPRVHTRGLKPSITPCADRHG